MRDSEQFNRAFRMKPFLYRLERFPDFYVQGDVRVHADLVLRLFTVGSVLLIVNAVLFGTVPMGTFELEWFSISGLFPEFACSGLVFFVEVCLFMAVCWLFQNRLGGR